MVSSIWLHLSSPRVHVDTTCIAVNPHHCLGGHASCCHGARPCRLPCGCCHGSLNVTVGRAPGGQGGGRGRRRGGGAAAAGPHPRRLHGRRGLLVERHPQPGDLRAAHRPGGPVRRCLGRPLRPPATRNLTETRNSITLLHHTLTPIISLEGRSSNDLNSR